ncbi:MAG: c-type cytochrome [Alphaproteobacteria bacterium]|nr:c-type cytochrome [Alphaproteobacteria bacterium]
MSRCLKSLALASTLLIAAPAWAEPLGIGRPATEAEIAAWDIDIRPDGAGLPEGSGSVADGEELFNDLCAVCHGDFGEGVDRWPVLAGGDDTLATEDPVKTVGSYWPYLSTVWDYVHRAMPFGDAQSLTDDEVYAITAYILYLNDLVDDDFELSKQNFAEARLPNEEGFFPDDREQSAVWQNREPCMENCKDAVEITARARVIDVTPDEAPAGAAEGSGSAEPAQESQAAAETQVAAAPAADPTLMAKGEKVFKKCGSCHQVGADAKHRVGPHLNGIFGRAAGTADGFSKYSKAMAAAGADGLIWDEATLTEFLSKPKDYIAKNRMSFAGLRKPDELEALIAYLKEISAE